MVEEEKNMDEYKPVSTLKTKACLFLYTLASFSKCYIVTVFEVL